MRRITTGLLAPVGAHGVYHDHVRDSDPDRPATEEEINQITGESGRWLPSPEEWLLVLAIAALLIFAEALLG